MWPLGLNANSQTALSEAPVVANLTADQQHLECAQNSESVHTCIPPASNLQVTDIPQHHHLNKWAGKYFFIFTQEPGNSPWLLDLWTESLPLHKSLAPLRLHALKTLYLICWWLLSVRRATEDSIPEPAVAPVGVYRGGEEKSLENLRSRSSPSIVDSLWA